MRARRIGSIVFTCMLLGIGLPLAMFQSAQFDQIGANHRLHVHSDRCRDGENCSKAHTFWLTRLVEAIVPTRYWTVIDADHLSGDEGSLKISYYDRAIKGSPFNWRLYNYRAVALCSKGQYSEALADHDMSIKLAPDIGYLYSNRGYTRSHAGDFKGGLADCDVAVNYDPSFSYAYNNRGYARYNLGDKEGAIADFEKAIELDVANPHAFLNLDDARHDRTLRKWRN